jgi:hypothetical protein
MSLIIQGSLSRVVACQARRPLVKVGHTGAVRACAASTGAGSLHSKSCRSMTRYSRHLTEFEPLASDTNLVGAEEALSDTYNKEMQSKMGTSQAYRHEVGIPTVAVSITLLLHP